MQAVQPRPASAGRASLWVFVGLAGVSAALTVVFLSMRAVMDVGGFCAEGGPYVISQRCPEGVPLLMVAGIWGGLVMAGVYIAQVSRHHLPSFAGLLWPALFLSLGWNFLAYGLGPPGGEGPAWGWLVCAAVFGVMGGLPLIGTVKASVRGLTAHREEPAPRAPSTVRRLKRRIAPSAGAKRMVDELERLHALHTRGALSDEEYRAAKTRILEMER